MKYLNKLARAALTVAASMAFYCCSTTSRLADDEILYTGLKPTDYITPQGEKVPEGLKDAIKSSVAVKPNNAITPSLRYPFPLGLWVYNHWPDPEHGFRHWLYKTLAKEPVLVSDVRPEVRTHIIDELLDNNGYFSGSAQYELIQGKNKKKASIRYLVSTGVPYPLDSIILLPDTTLLTHMIDSLAMHSKYLHKGERYSTDSLSAERIRITNNLRNHGFYYFRPEYIRYLADSTITPGAIALRIDLADNMPPDAWRQYKVGHITTTLYRNQSAGTPDTTQTTRGTLIRYMPERLRKGIIPSCITMRSGRVFRVGAMNSTQTNLSRLGIFNSIDMSVTPSATETDRLDVAIECTYDKPLEASLEVNVASKSNSYLGPGLTFGITNRNTFGGGELLNVSLTGAYEWQTGSRSQRSSVFNSYELGLSGSLSFPRLLAPKIVPRSRRDVNWTRLQLSGDLLNRPHYFRMAQFNTGISYDWRSTKYITNTLTAFKLTYTKLLNTTSTFDSIMDANKAIAQSFRNTFIPQVSYNFTFDRQMDRNNTINIQLGLQEAGNLFWGIYRLCGVKGEKQLFGTPFSQFVKATAQVVYGRRVAQGDVWLVSRLAAGAAHAYGNSVQVPYSEQFYCGGANSVRAFTVRSIGPGSYRAPEDQINGYFDQTGTFKFEANTELRFPILGPLHGATFIDAGNVWLLRPEASRPGGTLRASTFWRDLALGTGVGLRLDISMLVVRADLGIGIHAPYSTGKRGYYNMTSFRNSLAFHLAIGYPF